MSLRKSVPLLALFAMMMAGCGPPPVTAKRIPTRTGTTVRTSCPDAAPPLEDDPDVMVLTIDRTIERVCIYGSSSDENRAAVARVLGFQAGDKLDTGSARAALESLVGLRSLDDAAIGAELRGEGVIVHVTVRERPRVDEVVFEGVTIFDTKQLNLKTPGLGQPLDRKLMSAIVRALEDEYLRLGYGSAKIDPIVETPEAGHVRLRFVTREGPQWKLVKVSFPGASRISEADLKTAAKLKEGVTVQTSEIEHAALRVQTLYYARGMIQMKIGEPARDVAADGGVTVTFTIDEGDVFKVGSIKFGKLGEKLDKELNAQMKTKPNAVFDRSRLVTDINELRTFFKNRGKSVSVMPRTEIDAKKKVVNIVLDIENGSGGERE